MQNSHLKLSILGLVVGYIIAAPMVGKAVVLPTPDTYTEKQVAEAAATAIRTNSNAKFCSELLSNGNNKQALGYCVYWYYEAYKSGNQPEIIAARSFYLMVLDKLMKQVDNNLLERY